MYKIVSTQKLIKKLFQSHPKIKCLQYIHIGAELGSFV